ncbi:hypothetical protein L0M14_10280 [Paenibacillus hexagrammi]|uniref:Uncharacterized protein n=1 Tax=Paenibacillus hexagrammi TaxID=2908839 RepID=A0ABY3SNQ7_9BACL|nr:hypothetical protein [Paenibacillus sp. YPD9-1]UJF35447.1 hypothetical protein L0M14_10280 [Paenibacillus sp. YPD9-1]
MNKRVNQVIRKAEAKLGRKLTKRTIIMSLKKAVKVTRLGNGFARFEFAPVTVPANSFVSTAINGNSYNLISGSWIFSGNQQGYMLDNFSAAEDSWFFTAWNPTSSARTVRYAVIAKLKP